MTDIQDQTQTAASEKPTLTPEGIRSAVEAILFAAGHPVSFEKIAESIGITAAEAHACTEELIPMFLGRGIQLIFVGDGAQLVTREEFLPYIRHALGIRRGGNLSRASLETLAIIAYNQPVTRAYVDEVRGVDTGYVVSSLVEKGLIASMGRLDVPGRPTLYGTTDAFLRVFGLQSLADLPPADKFLSKEGDAEAQILSEA